MNTLIIFLGICSAVTSGSKLAAPHKECEKIVGCYYLNGPVALKRENVLSTKDIDASLCTHLYFESIKINADASVEIDQTEYKMFGFKELKDLQKKNNHLKTLVSMGEVLSYNPENLIKISTNQHLREKFANNVADFMKKYEFNGFEIDLKDEAQIKIQNNELASYQRNFVLLLKALREKFDKLGFILCITIGGSEAIAKLYDIKGVSKYVNFINLQTFDLHFFAEDMELDHNNLFHNAPIYASKKENAEERKLNIDYIVKYWLSSGAPPNKIILGTVFYGSGHTLANPKLIGRGAPISGILESNVISPAVGYYETCPLEKNPQWKHLYDEEQQVPYMYNGNQIISYENVESITRKAEYAKKMNLGGAMVWGIETDDFHGKCGEKFPLMRILNRVLRNKC